MNKIFKVIFNRTTQKMEVVSELAKSQGKAASSTDERSGISPLVGGLRGSFLVGGTALLMISAMPAEAVVSITGNNYYSNGDPTGTYINKIGDTYAYNYYNPGSLSYKDPSTIDNTGGMRRYSETLHLEGIAIGNNTTILSRQVGNNYNNGIAIGDHSQSTGGLSIAIGGLSKATDIGAVALGTASYASGFNSFAAMRQSAAKADYAAAIGSSSWANATASFAMGASATALGERSFAIGSGVPQTLDQNTGEARRSIYDGQNNTYSYGNDAFSIGTKAKTNGNNAFAIGTNANAGGFKTETRTDLPINVNTFIVADTAKSAENAFALGTDTNANSKDSVAFSTNATATGNGSISFGVNSVANGTGAIAFGNVSKTEGENAISIGWNSSSTEANVTTIGANAVTTKKGGTAIGESAKSKGVDSSTIGFNSSVYSDNATAIGTNSTVTATGTGGTSVGFNTSVSGQYGTAIAYKATASGQNALAVGTQTTVSGNNSGAFGQSNTVSGQNTFVLGSNVQATTDGSVILGNSSTIATAARIDSATVGSLTYSGFAGDEDVAAGDYVSVGSSENERQIKFVAPGEISKTSTDAINGSQLYATNDIINNVTTSIKDNFGGNAVVNPNGTITYTDIGGTGKDNINDAIKAAKTEVKAGNNVNVTSEDGSSGQKIYTVNANHTTVSVPTGNKYLSVKDENKANNVTNYEISLTPEAITDFTKDDNTITDVVDDKKGYVQVEEVVPNGREGDYKTYKVSLSDKAITDFTKDTSATVKEGSSYVTVTSTTNSTNANVTDYTVDVSESTKNTITTNTNNIATNTQNIANNTAEINKGFGLQAQDGKNVNKKLGEFVEVVGGNNNINTTVADGKVKVNLNNTLDLGNDGSVTIGDTKVDGNGLTITGGPNVTKNGIDAGSKKITNVADGTISADSKEAVNGSQLHATNQNVTNVSNNVTKLDEFVKQGFNITADNGNEDNVQLGEKITYTSTDKNIITTVSDNQIDFVLNSTLKIGGKDGAPGIGLDGANGTIGLTGPKGDNGESATANITVKNGKPGVDGKDGETKTRIVYDGEEVATLNDGLKFGANTGAVHNAKLNTQVNVKGAEANQDWSKFDQGQNIMTQINGNNITVALAKDVNLTETGSLTIGGTTVNKDGVTINNTKITNDGDNVKVGDKNGNAVKITNVKDGELSNTSKDAVNGSQLYATNQNVTNLSNKVAEGFNIDADKRGEGLDKADNVQLGETVKYTSTDKNIITTVTNNTIDFGLANEITVGEKGEPGVAGKDGKDGKVGVKGANGSAVVLNGKDGSIGLNGKDGKDGLTFQGKDGSEGVDGTNGKDGKNGLPGENGKTRIVYQPTDKNGTPVGTPEEVATLNDGLIFTGNNEKLNRHKLNTVVKVVGEGVDKAASETFSSAKGNINVVANGTDELQIRLNKDLDLTDKGSVKTGNTTVNNDGVTIAKKADAAPTKSDVKLTQDGLSNGGNQITNVDSGLKGKDGQVVKLTDATGDVLNNAVNVGDLKNTVTEVATNAFGLKDENGKEFKQNLGTTAQIIGDSNIKTNVVEKDGEKALKVSLANNITVGKDGEPGKVGVAGKDGKDGVSINGDDGKDGKPGEASVVVGRNGKDGDNGIDGKVGVNGKDGSAVVLNGKDGSIGLNGKDGKDGLTIKGIEGKPGLVGKDGLPGKDGVTRIQYQPTNPDGSSKGEPEQVATLNDGLHFKGDNEPLVSKKLNETLEIVGGAPSDKLTNNNIGVNNNGGKLVVQLAKELSDLNKATFVPKDGEDGATTVVDNNGTTITPKDGKNGKDGNVVSLTKDGLNNGNNQIVNVKSGIDGVKGQDGQAVKSVNDLTGDQLKDVGTNAANINDVANASKDLIAKGFKIDADNRDGLTEADTVELGQTVEYRSESGNIVTTVSNNKIDFDLADKITVGGLGKNGKDGVDGKIGVKGADGKDGVTITPDAIVFHGKDGANGQDGKPGLSISGAEGKPGLVGEDGKPGKNGVTRIQYQPTDPDGSPKGEPEQVATLNDGLHFTGNNSDTLNSHKLNTIVNIVGEGVEKGASETFVSAAGNINVKADGKDKLEIQLAKDLKDLNSATFGPKDGADAEPTTVVGRDGITITPAKDENGEAKDPVKLTQKGLDNGNNQIVNVKSGIDGLAGKDGINGKDGKPITSVNDLTKEQLEKVGTNGANINDVVNASNGIIEKGFSIAADRGETDHVKLGETVTYTSTDKNIITTAIGENKIDFALANTLSVGKDGEPGKPGEAGTIGVKGQDGKDGVSIKGDNGKDGTPGEATITVGRNGKDGADGDNGIDGKVGVNGKDGSAVVLNGKDGSIGLNGKDGKDGLTFKSADGAQGVNGKDGANGLPGQNGTTRIVYQPTDKGGNPQGEPETVATLNDGLIFAGNNDKLNRHKLNSVVNIVGEVAQGINDKESSENFKSAAGNINVVANEKDQLEIQLNRDLKDLANAKFVEYKKGDDGKEVVDNTKPSTEITNKGITITPANGENGADAKPVSLTDKGLDNGNNQIVNVKSGIDGVNGQPGKDGKAVESVNDLTDEQLDKVGTNAANIKDVRNATDGLINKGFNITADNGTEDNVKLGETVKYTSDDKNIITTVRNNEIDFGLASNLTVGKDGKDGKPGEAGSIGVKGQDGKNGVSISGDNGKDGQPGEATISVGRDGKDGDAGIDGKVGVNGKDGSAVVLNGKDGSIGLNGKDGANGLTFKAADGAQGVDGKDGKDGLPGTGKDGEPGKTRIVYETKDKDGKPVTEEVATLNDGLIFTGNNAVRNVHKLNTLVTIIGEGVDKATSEVFKSAAGNINVKADGNGNLTIQLAKDVNLTNDGSVKVGDTLLNSTTLTVGGTSPITVDGNKGTIGGLTNKTFDPNNFTSGQAATEDQLKQVYDVANSGWDIAANGQNTTNVGPKGKVSFNNEDGNIIITKETTDNNVTFALNNNLTIGGPGKDGQPGKDGSIGVKGADGTTGVTLNGKDGSIGINGKDGTNGTVTFAQGKPGVDGKDGETKSRIVYETKDKDGNPVKEEVATLNDGLKFVGDDGKVITKKLNETLSITGGEKDATKLSDANNIGVVNNNGTLTVKLAKDIDLTKDGSVTIGDTTVNNDGLTIKDGPSVTKVGINAGDKKITNVQDGEISETSKDAVNGSQLYQVQKVANAGWNLTANGKDKGNVKPGATVDLNNKDGNIIITKEGNNVTFGLNNNLTIGGKDGKDGQIGVAGKDGKDGVTIKGDGTITAGRDGKDGVDGSIGATGKDGASVVLNGKDGSIGLTGPKGADGKPGASANIAVKDGAEGVDGTNGKDGLPGENGKTRIVYETKDKDGKTVTEQVATLNDGLIFSGNNEDVKNRQKLNTEVKVKGEGVDKTASENFKSASGNINVKANGTDTLEVQLAKAIDLTEDGSVTTGDTTVNNNGLTIKDGPSVTKGGIDAKGTKITNVKDGDVTATSKDAVNGSQLYNAMQNTGWDLTVDGNVAETSEKGAQRVNNNGKVAVSGGKNIVVSRKGSTVEIATSSNPEFDTVKVGGTTLSSTVAKDGVNELNVAGKDGSATRITNVAPGVKGTDAVNVNQLRSVANHVNNVDKDLRAGVAGALAAGNLYHVTQPGKSMVSAGVGTYRGQGALAVGYSRLSDNGKVGIKFSVNSNSRGHAGAAASVGYQW